MDLILKFASMVYGSLGDEFDSSISDENAAKLNYYVRAATNAFTKHEFHIMILSLLVLQQFISDNIRPESLTAEFVDFMSDQNMWDWISKSASNKNPDQEDWSAAKYVFEDLKFIIDNDKLVEFDKEMVA